MNKRKADYDSKENCCYCSYFLSYRRKYNDEQEPDDCGICLYPNWDLDNSASDIKICDFFTRIK